ncbi:gamma-glutamylcyclotransferase family protein [Thalassobacillus devorans]|uniref:gamma-glutamylcyclotransferase family protein n=1 Tax=Thalassobacillus devorans TaxID=279813 RepID=UPI0004B0B80A|nr:gamma-glutamylcyclotransferase family protein [Thalassobacillus devorans]
MPRYLFAYGTLRKHQPNHFHLKDAELVSEQARTTGRLYEGPSYYPVLMEEDTAVYGELYKVDDETLAKIDELEGFQERGLDNLYDRKMKEVETDQGSYQAYVYYLSPNRKEMAETSIQYGDWKVHELLKKDEVTYFAFGSCMDAERFKLAGVDHYFHQKLGRGVLEGYRLLFSHHVHDGGRADIMEADNHVEGVLYRTPLDAVEYLFKREGVEAGHYRPTVVDIKQEDKQLKDVLTFYVLDKKPDLPPPFHYAKEIHRGAAYCLSDDYMNHLETLFVEKFQVDGFSDYVKKSTS